jgi:hypothetical protein
MGETINYQAKFLLKTLGIASPIIVFLLIYTCLDPFKVVWNYDDYYDFSCDSKRVWGVVINRDNVGTMTFDKYYKQNGYNSFILGNSRSIFYEIADWKQYLNENSSCYHFDSYGESLYGLSKKVEYIERKKINIDNALVVLDYVLLSLAQSPDKYLNMVSPRLDHYKNVSEFHVSAIKAFASPNFFVAYLDYRISGEIKPYMVEKKLLSKFEISYDLKTNEITYPQTEKQIEEGKYFTPEIMEGFKRDDTTQPFRPVIQERQKELLQGIYEVFKKSGATYKIVVSPLYDQVKLNPDDLAYLESLFGKQNVFDFSGVNAFTADYSNYYDGDSHYRPHVAREIMRLVYTNDNR